MEDYNQIVQKVQTDEVTKLRLSEKLDEIKDLTIGNKASMVPILLKEKIVLEDAIQLSLTTCRDAYDEIEKLEDKVEILEHEVDEYKKQIDPGKQEEIEKLCAIKRNEIESRPKKSSQRMMQALERNYLKSRGLTQKYLK